MFEDWTMNVRWVTRSRLVMCTRREVGERVFRVALASGVPAPTTVVIDMPTGTKPINAERRTEQVCADGVPVVN